MDTTSSVSMLEMVDTVFTATEWFAYAKQYNINMQYHQSHAKPN